MSGIEILGIAASVVQIADAGARLSSKLFVFTRKVKNADRSISDISQEIAATGAALRELGEALEDDKYASLGSKRSVDTTSQIVADCWKVFTDINDTIGGDQLIRQREQHDEKSAVALTKYKPPSYTLKQRLMFPYRESQVKLLKAKLEGLKSSLMLMLQVLLLAEQVRNRPKLAVSEEQKALLQTLVDERNAKEAEFRSSCVALDNALVVPSDLESFNTDDLTSTNTLTTDEQVIKEAFTPRAIPALCEPGNVFNVFSVQPASQPSLEQEAPLRGSTESLAEADVSSSPGATKLTPATSISEPTISSSSNKSLPRSLKMRQRDIEHHAQLVQNLLEEISNVQHRIDHGIRHRMHDGVLKLHWDEWSPHALKHGHEHFHQSFEKHEHIARYWIDQDEDGVTSCASTPAVGSKATSKEAVHFKDAIGRRYNFPVEVCQSWYGISQLITQAFTHIEGLDDHVSQGRFDLVAPDGSLILPSLWNSMVRPGMEVSMTIWPLPELPQDPKALPDTQSPAAITGLDDLPDSPEEQMKKEKMKQMKQQRKKPGKSTKSSKTLAAPDEMGGHNGSNSVLKSGAQPGTDSVYLPTYLRNQSLGEMGRADRFAPPPVNIESAPVSRQGYQMQMMLLEPQNKKRLMMARQEQENAVNRDGMDGGPLQGVVEARKMNNSPEPQADAEVPNPDPEISLDEEQVRVCQELFTDFDHGSRGCIPANVLEGALETFLANLGYSDSVEVDAEGILELERGREGLSTEGIDMDLFTRCAARCLQIHKAYEESTVLLRIFDKDSEKANDGDELKEVIISLGGAISDQEYDAFLRDHATSGTHQLAYADCLSLLRRAKLLTGSDADNVTKSAMDNSDEQKPLAVVKLHRRTYQQHLKAVQEHEEWKRLERPLAGMQDREYGAFRLQDALDAGSMQRPEKDVFVKASWPRWAFAMWAYQGTAEADLSFGRGDFIEVLSEGDGTWWVGRLGVDLRKSGFIPANHVSYMPVGFVPEVITRPSQHSRRDSSGEIDQTQTKIGNRTRPSSCQDRTNEEVDRVDEQDTAEAEGEEVVTMRVPDILATAPNTSYVAREVNPVFVNDRQFLRILKRRVARQRLEENLKNQSLSTQLHKHSPTKQHAHEGGDVIDGAKAEKSGNTTSSTGIESHEAGDVARSRKQEALDLDVTTGDDVDVLADFDFDSFLNTTPKDNDQATQMCSTLLPDNSTDFWRNAKLFAPLAAPVEREGEGRAAIPQSITIESSREEPVDVDESRSGTLYSEIDLAKKTSDGQILDRSDVTSTPSDQMYCVMEEAKKPAGDGLAREYERKRHEGSHSGETYEAEQANRADEEEQQYEEAGDTGVAGVTEEGMTEAEDEVVAEGKDVSHEHIHQGLKTGDPQRELRLHSYGAHEVHEGALCRAPSLRVLDRQYKPAKCSSFADAWEPKEDISEKAGEEYQEELAETEEEECQEEVAEAEEEECQEEVADAEEECCQKQVAEAEEENCWQKYVAEAETEGFVEEADVAQEVESSKMGLSQPERAVGVAVSAVERYDRRCARLKQYKEECDQQQQLWQQQQPCQLRQRVVDRPSTVKKESRRPNLTHDEVLNTSKSSREAIDVVLTGGLVAPAEFLSPSASQEYLRPSKPNYHAPVADESESGNETDHSDTSADLAFDTDDDTDDENSDIGIFEDVLGHMTGLSDLLSEFTNLGQDEIVRVVG